jgi:hypothetical protein
VLQKQDVCSPMSRTCSENISNRFLENVGDWISG